VRVWGIILLAVEAFGDLSKEISPEELVWTGAGLDTCRGTAGRQEELGPQERILRM
jgi:hypothetical protein